MDLVNADGPSVIPTGSLGLVTATFEQLNSLGAEKIGRELPISAPTCRRANCSRVVFSNVPIAKISGLRLWFGSFMRQVELYPTGMSNGAGRNGARLCYIHAMHTYSIVVRLKNGSPDLSEGLEPVLPSALIQCKELWKDRGRRRSWPKDQWAFVRRAIEPLLYARIEPETEHCDGGLLNWRGIIQAQAIELSSVSFENGPIPTISGYAQFEMTFDRAFADTAAFYDWQEQTDWLDWALCFGFRFADGGEWDATWEHQGIDFELFTSSEGAFDRGIPKVI